MSTSLKDTIALLVGDSTKRVNDLPISSSQGVYRLLSIHSLSPGTFQPRKIFNEKPLNELATSIREEGILQPIIVRPLGEDKFEIIAGERRWRAAQLAELSKVPVIVRDICDQSALAFGILENLQRENLNPVEEAQAYRKLIEEFALTHEEIASKVGKSRSYISNSIRLLNLPDYIQNTLSMGIISIGHAKTILALEQDRMDAVFNKLIKNKLSVRQLEKIVIDAQLNHQIDTKDEVFPDVGPLEKKIAQLYGVTCKIKPNLTGGAKIVIECKSLKDFDYLINN
jgi:ParB family chromosome partitioning protein